MFSNPAPQKKEEGRRSFVLFKLLMKKKRPLEGWKRVRKELCNFIVLSFLSSLPFLWFQMLRHIGKTSQALGTRYQVVSYQVPGTWYLGTYLLGTSSDIPGTKTGTKRMEEGGEGRKKWRLFNFIAFPFFLPFFLFLLSCDFKSSDTLSKTTQG